MIPVSLRLGMASMAAPTDHDATPVRPPNFREVVAALGVDRSRTLARRAQLLLARLLEEAPELAAALEPILSARGGRLRLCGTTSAGQASLSWDDSRARADLRAAADFYLESVALKSRKRYEGSTAFVTLSTLSAAQVLAAVQVAIANLRGSDEAILAALHRDFPALHGFLAGIADLEHTAIIRSESDYVAIRLRAPLNRAAIKAHYPSIDRMHGWIKELIVDLTDGQGRRLARIGFDGSRRRFCLDAHVRDGEFLLGDDNKPLRDSDGQPLALGFGLAESQSFVIHVQVTTALVRLGRLRLGSCRLPESSWDLSFVGSERGDRADWRTRVSAISPPRAPLKWVVPLDKIFAMFKDSFRLRVRLLPRPGDDELHELDIDYGLHTPRSALLDLAETLLRWGSRTSVLRDLLGLWHDLAASLASDLEEPR